MITLPKTLTALRDIREHPAAATSAISAAWNVTDFIDPLPLGTPNKHNMTPVTVKPSFGLPCQMTALDEGGEQAAAGGSQVGGVSTSHL